MGISQQSRAFWNASRRSVWPATTVERLLQLPAGDDLSSQVSPANVCEAEPRPQAFRLIGENCVCVLFGIGAQIDIRYYHDPTLPDHAVSRLDKCGVARWPPAGLPVNQVNFISDILQSIS